MLATLRAFLAVAQEGSIHRAAIRLRVSQSALSRQMQALEHEVGGRLLERTSTGVKLTAGGHALQAKIGPVLAGYDGVLRDVRRLVRGEADRLRIGYLPSAGREHLDAALTRVRREHPATAIKLLDLSPGEQAAALRAAEIDVGLTMGSVELLGRDFYARKLATRTSCVVLPEQHPLARLKNVRLAQLKHETFVKGTEEQVPGITSRLTAYCRTYGGFRPKYVGPAHTLAESFEISANENAIVLLPAFTPQPAGPGVVIRPLADPEVTWDLLVVWQRGKPGSALRSLLDALFAK
jgi:DNA-binding transcriptional LysR family regulator